MFCVELYSEELKFAGNCVILDNDSILIGVFRELKNAEIACRNLFEKIGSWEKSSKTHYIYIYKIPIDIEINDGSYVGIKDEYFVKQYTNEKFSSSNFYLKK